MRNAPEENEEGRRKAGRLPEGVRKRRRTVRPPGIEEGEQRLDIEITDIPYEEGTVFFAENGLEISGSGDDAPVLYCRGIYEKGVLIAAAAVTLKSGKKVLDYIAVRPEYRKQGLGERLLSDIFSRVTPDGSERLWLVAKTPAFFYAVGAADAEGGEELLAECNGCGMRGIQCNPKVMAFGERRGRKRFL